MTRGRAADGVFVEVETQLACAATGGRRIGRHAADGFAGIGARLKHCGSLHHDRAWASRPSARASVVMAGASLLSASRDQFLDGNYLDEIGRRKAAAQTGSADVGRT